MNNDRWVDSIVEAMQLLDGDAHYSELYPIVKKIRQSKGLSIPVSFEAIVRGRIENHSSDSKQFIGADIFVNLGKGHWGLRSSYKNAQTFNNNPIENQTNEMINRLQNVLFDDEIDDLSAAEDGKQLQSLEEARLKKLHYRYEGRLKASQIKKIKAYKGYICEACGMSFAKKYPGLGKDFIECHHKIPYADMKEGEARNLNVDDFMVLCSNCHKMIHRLDNPANLEQLKAILVKGSES